MEFQLEVTIERRRHPGCLRAAGMQPCNFILVLISHQLGEVARNGGGECRIGGDRRFSLAHLFHHGAYVLADAAF